MRFTRTKIAVLGAALVLAACGGGSGPGEQGARVPFSSMVAFGDSLSDGGTYKVGTVAAIGGGKFTVNGTGNLVWTERIAADIGVTSCPAQTGLLPSAGTGLTGAAVVQNTSCFNYAQGSSRVSNIYAPNSATLQALGLVNIGLTATPVATQIANHLARKGGTFSGTELVTVMAGGNDIFMNTNGVQQAGAGGAGAAGAAFTAGWSQTVQNQLAVGSGAANVNIAATAAVTAMGAAGAELAGLVKTQILAKGAKYVVVVNLPDVSQTPSAAAADAATRGLINQMVTTFNAQLASGLAGANVILVDAYTQGRDQTANPSQYSLSNVTGFACSTTAPTNPLAGSSLGCNSTSLVAGDTSHYLYADSVHPTPFGHQLLAQFVAVQMAKAGWL